MISFLKMESRTRLTMIEQPCPVAALPRQCCGDGLYTLLAWLCPSRFHSIAPCPDSCSGSHLQRQRLDVLSCPASFHRCAKSIRSHQGLGFWPLQCTKQLHP